jgi:phage terminase large subunit
MVYAEADSQVELRGAPRWLLESVLRHGGKKVKREIIIAGPGGTGKSRGILQVIAYFCETYPSLRVLLCRKTRESMTSSTLVEWEECFPEGHEVLDGPQREQRSIYHFANGSEVAIIGLDKPQKVFSTKWDIIYFEELTEEGVTLEQWELFYRGLRGNKSVNGQHLLIGTCNPTYPEHWVRQRILEKQCETYDTKHADNPRWHRGSLNADGTYAEEGWTEEGRSYIEGLRKMSGYTRRRLLDGEWCSADGLVLPEYDKGLHVIDARIDRHYGDHYIFVAGREEEPITVDWYFVSMDFGFRAPGCLHLWAVDADDKLYRVVEVYQRGRNLDWWADVLCTLAREFPFNRGVADCADPLAIDFLNDRLGSTRGRDMRRIIQPSDKSGGKLHGLDQFRWGLTKDSKGPRTFFFKDALRYGRDMELKSKGKPTCLEEELTAYVWKKVKNGAAESEEPDPNSADHAIDSAVYAHVFAWKKDLKPNKPKRTFKPGTLGALLTSGGKELPWPKYR